MSSKHKHSDKQKRIAEILDQVSLLASEYGKLTGKPLGVTGEVGEYKVSCLLDLTLTPPRQPGHDATGVGGRKYEIKSRITGKPIKRSKRTSKINIDDQWDAALLCCLDDDLQPICIYEADREAVLQALLKPGSKARNERHTLSISQFISIGRCVWPVD
ncbi:MAG: hypothetical protein GY927_12430 [bacterium]|nr:hypothetical protein [bacterium]